MMFPAATEELKAFVKKRLTFGTDPNEISSDIEEVVEQTIQAWANENGWSQWGDGNWYLDTACSICGSSLPGICGHEKDPKQVVLRGVEAQRRSETAT